MPGVHQLPLTQRRNIVNIESLWRDTAGHLEVVPCATCGSYRRVRMRLFEPRGYVCLDCRRDDAGIVWSSRAFDPYIAHLHRWQDAGIIDQEVVAARAPTSRALEPPPRRRDLLSEETRQAVVTAYQAGEKIRDIVQRNELANVHDMYAIIADAGVLKRIDARRSAQATGMPADSAARESAST